MEKFFANFIVSRETKEQLLTYEATLQKWQKKINLVSNNTLSEAWLRHFLDSAQIISHISKKDKKVVDFGSGAGFPGMVINIIAKDLGYDLSTVLVESDVRKCAFLQEIKRLTKQNVEIKADRVENLTALEADVIVSRALAPLEKLLQYSFKHITKYGVCIFNKGQNIEGEISQALLNWQFDYTITESLSDKTGKIVKITNLKSK